MEHNRAPMPLKRNVRFGSKADMCAAKGHVRFAPNCDRESEIQQTTMSLERTWIRAPLFWARASLTVFIEFLS